MCMSVGLYMCMCVYVYVMCKNVVGLSIKYKIIFNYVKMITKLQLQNQILFMPQIAWHFLAVLEWSARLKLKLFKLWAPIDDTSFIIQCSVDMTHAKGSLTAFAIQYLSYARGPVHNNGKKKRLTSFQELSDLLLSYSFWNFEKVKGWNWCSISFLWDLCKMTFPNEWRTSLWLPLLLWHVMSESMDRC